LDPQPVLTRSRNGSPSGGRELDDYAGLADEQNALLDWILNLKFANIEGVDPPKIVSVGQQDAGKSTLLQAISGEPFQRRAGPCTSFVTEIYLHRSAKGTAVKTEYDVIPYSKRLEDDQERLRHKFRSLSSNTTFEQVMEMAKAELSPSGGHGRFVSEDILVIKKTGPEMPQLTIIDVPGLVNVPNSDQNEEDIEAIKSLSFRYMESKRTIILASVSGEVDYSQQHILGYAKIFDPTGERTIGVLTKPDLIHGRGGESQEARYIDLVTNKDESNKFKLGWYVLRNPSHKDKNYWTPEERQRHENELFSKTPWSGVPEAQRGCAALVKQLSNQLMRLTVHSLPEIEHQIKTELAKHKTELVKLGDAKNTPAEMQLDLVESANIANKIVDFASIGHYHNPQVDIDKEPVKFFPEKQAGHGDIPIAHLRARIVKANEQFADRVRLQDPKGHRPNGSKMSDSEYAERFIKPLIEQNGGTEFTGEIPNVVYILFREFSAGWHDLALNQIVLVNAICDNFFDSLVDCLFPKKRLREYYLNEQLNLLKESAVKELKKLERDRGYDVKSYNPEYTKRLERWRSKKIADKKPDSPAEAYKPEEELLEKVLTHYSVSPLLILNPSYSNLAPNLLNSCLLPPLSVTSFRKLLRGI
jgi:GTPase SAR1 family protein